jgi:hypothetical protein
MSDIQEYPLALYQGGDLTGAVLVVNDAQEEKLAKAEGFIRHGHKMEKAAGEGEMSAKDLKEELTKRDIEFRGNASRDVLQGLYDEALAKEKAAGEGEA